MNYTAYKFWLDAVQVMAVVLLGIYTWWKGRATANQSAIDRVEEKIDTIKVDADRRLDSHSDRILMIEKNFEKLPQISDISHIQDTLGVINREVGELSSKLTATYNMLSIHQEFLMNQNKKG